MGSSDRAWVADQAPRGWRLGKWSERSQGLWEERKSDDPSIAFEFDLVGGSDTAGSNTIRLRMREANTEVILTAQTAQIFVEGHYFGEYSGHWEVGGQPLPPPLEAAPARSGAYPAQALGQPMQAPAFRAGAAPQAAGAVQRMPSNGMPPAAGLASPQKSFVFGGPSPIPAQNLDQSPGMVDQLYKASEKGDAEAVKRLLGAGVDPNFTKEGRGSPLLIATSKKHLAVVQVLIDYGADPYMGSPGDTPTLVAFRKGYTDIVKVLFKAGFQALECAMSPGELDICAREEWDGRDEGVSMHALNELHETTAKLLAFKNRPTAEDHESEAEAVVETEDEEGESRHAEGPGFTHELKVREALRNLVHSGRMMKHAFADVKEEEAHAAKQAAEEKMAEQAQKQAEEADDA